MEEGAFSTGSGFPALPGLPEDFEVAPRRPLRTIRRALESAAGQDDAGAMTRLLLLHAEWLKRIHRATLLELVRAGELERAWQLADAMPDEQRALWHLLLAWELHGTGRPAEARATLERLWAGELSLLEEDHGGLAAFLLAHVYPVDAALFTDLHEALLDERRSGPLCRCLAQAGPLSAALELAAVRHLSWDAGSSLQEIVEVLIESGELTAALETAWQMPDGFSRDEALKDVAGAQVKQGRYADAEETAREIDDPYRREEVLATLAGARLRAGQRPAAGENLVDALERSWPEADARRSLELLEHFAAAFGYPEDSSAAQAVAAGAVAALAERESSLEQAMRRVCQALQQIQAGGSTGALAVLAEGRRIADRITDPVHQAMARGAVAQGLAQAGDGVAACSVFAAAREGVKRARFRADPALSLPSAEAAACRDVRDRLLVALVRAQAQVGDWSGAWETARALERNWRHHVVTKCLVPAQVQRGDLAAAWQIAHRIKDSLARSTIVATIARAQARDGDWSAVRKSAAVMPLVDMRAALLRELAQRQLEAGERPAAERALRDALELVSQQEYDFEWQPALRKLIPVPSHFADPGLARGLLAGLREILREKPVGRQDLELLRAVAAALEQWGEPRAARDCLSLALDEARPWEEEEEEARRGALHWLALGQAEIGEITQALAIDQAVEGGCDGDYTLAGIATIQVRRGELAGAWAIVGQIENPIALASVLPVLAAAEARRGEPAAARTALAAALAAARRIDVIDYRIEAWEQIAQKVAAAGDLALADQALAAAREAAAAEGGDGLGLARLAAVEVHAGRLEAALEIAAGLRDPADQCQAFRGIGEALEQTKQPDAARGAFAAAREAARRIKSAPMRLLSFHGLARSQARAAQYSEALETLRQTNDPEEMEIAVATMQAWQGAFAAASETAARIESPDRQPWEVIAIAQARAGEFAAARDSARAIRNEARVETLGRIALAQAPQGEEARATLAEALAVAQTIEAEATRMAALVSLAPVQAALAMGEQVVETAAVLRLNRARRMHELGSALAAVGDRGNFKRLLLQSLDCPAEAFRFAGLLGQIYPEQGAAVAAAILHAGTGQR